MGELGGGLGRKRIPIIGIKPYTLDEEHRAAMVSSVGDAKTN